MATKVTGEEYYKLDGQLLELTRQLRQPSGYPHDLQKLSDGLRDLIEGRFRTVNIVPIYGQATWRVEGEYLIYFTLPASQGLTGEQWIERLYRMDKNLSDNAKAALRSAEFVPTPVGTIHRVVALRATFWKGISGRTTKVVQAEGVTRKWLEIHPEAICIIRECFSDDELKKIGLCWIVGVHKTIEVDGLPHWLSSNCRDLVGDRLRTYWAYPDLNWRDCCAFAFALPQENQS